MVNERRWLASIFGLYFLLAFGYSVLMPIWEAPDEPAHYHLAWSVARRNRYPTYENNYEAYQPRAYYYAASYVLRGLDKIDRNYSNYYVPPYEPRHYRKPTHMYEWSDGNYRLMLGVYSLRWINILFGGLTLWFGWKGFRLLAPERLELRLSALALAALTPQYLHIMSSVSNDAVGTLAGAVLFYLALRFTDQPSNVRAAGLVSLAVLLPLLTKLTVLPVSAAVILIVLRRWFAGERPGKWLFVAAMGVLSGAGILYIFFPELLQTAWREIEWRLFGFRKNAFTEKYLRFILSQVMWTYWGKVGWVAIGLHKLIVDVLTALGLMGLILHAYRLLRERTEYPQFRLWLGTWLIALVTLAAVLRNALTTSATQGRLLFPAIGALSILMVGGWHSASPQWMRRYFPSIVTLIMLVSTLSLWFWGIVPVYYQPFLD